MITVFRYYRQHKRYSFQQRQLFYALWGGEVRKVNQKQENLNYLRLKNQVDSWTLTAMSCYQGRLPPPWQNYPVQIKKWRQ